MVKTGIILEWKEGLPVPDGYALCDGKHNTPDLRKKFTPGYSVYIMKT